MLVTPELCPGDTRAVSWWHHSPGRRLLTTLLPFFRWVFLVYSETCSECPPVPPSPCHRCPGCATGGACAILVPFCVPKTAVLPSRHNVCGDSSIDQCTVRGAVSSCSCVVSVDDRDSQMIKGPWYFLFYFDFFILFIPTFPALFPVLHECHPT